MGGDTLRNVSKKDCLHDWEAVWEDSVLFGNVYYYDKCSKCGKLRNTDPGPLALGVYK